MSDVTKHRIAKIEAKAGLPKNKRLASRAFSTCGGWVRVSGARDQRLLIPSA